MNNLSTTKNDGNKAQIAINNTSSIYPAGQSKKRKVLCGSTSIIKVEVSQLANKRSEQYVKNLEAEKFQHFDECNKELILKLEDMVAKLQAKNEEQKSQHNAEMDSIINEYSQKIKTFEDEKKQFESKIKELTDEISSMKIIQSEIKDSVENERETFESETIKLKAEINELKNQNYVLEQCNRNLFENYGNEVKILKEEKEAAEKELKNLKENVQSPESKEKMGEERKHFLATIDALKAENQNLSNVNINFMNAKKSLQNSFNDFKKRIKNLETHKSEMQNFQLDDVFSDLFFGPFNPKK